MLTPISEKLIDIIFAGLCHEKNFVFLETSKPSGENKNSFIFLNLFDTLTCKKSDDPEIFFQQAQRYLDCGYYLAGYFSYEFGYLLDPVFKNFRDKSAAGNHTDQYLARLGVFPSPIIFNHEECKFTPKLPFPESLNKTAANEEFSISNIHPSIKKTTYLKRLAKIKSYIRAGDTYQVNYTLKLLFNFSGSPEALYKTLRYNQPVSYSAYINFDGERVLSFSPELFFRKDHSECLVRPMKGTMTRGRTLAEDRQKAAFLKGDIKNRSENIMIVDLLRNDLGRLSEMGTVKTTSLFDVETYATLHQMTSTITGQLSEHKNLSDLFRSLFPCGSVTGAPKIRTMQIIHELEKHRRGIYTGGIGFISPEGNACFNVPIRTIVLNSGKGEMGIGSGIVNDSDHESEWNECLLKAKFLTEPKPDFQIIESMLWEKGKGAWLLDKHLDRLARSCEYYGYPFSRKETEHKIQEAADNCLHPVKRLRVLCHRDGEIKITSARCDLPEHTVLPLPKTSAVLPKVMVSKHKTNHESARLFHKTTIRPLYDWQRQKALSLNFFEVFFMNKDNQLTEGSISNIIIKKNGYHFTPPVSCGLLPGVFREYLLETYPSLLSEKILTITDLQNADAIYMVNSVRGIIQVSL